MSMNWFPKRIRTITLVFLAALLVPIFIRSPYILHIGILMGVWIILTDSLNFVTGFAGQLALGHAAFITIGAYTGALLMIHYGLPFWVGLVIGGVVAFASGLILGLMALRLRGDYLGMVTLGFGEIIRIFAINLVDLTRGQSGLPSIPRPSIFGFKFTNEVPYYFLILIFIAIGHMAIERMLLSRFGRACLAVRDDEAAAKAMGVQSYYYKVLSFCIACGFAGLVGVFYASWITMYSPTSFVLNDSLMMSVMETLGGIGSLYGSIPGAAIIGGLPELLRTFLTGARIASLRFALMGLLLILLMIIRPQGLFGMSIRRGYISLEPIRRLFVRNKEEKKGKHESLKFDCVLDDHVVEEVANE
jgi:branched-chain amino acid transport system permease protein